jgi:hypothetical protein
MGIGAIPTFQGIATAQGVPITNAAASPTSRILFPAYSNFSSNHNGIVYFTFADGSVRGLVPASTGQRNPASTDWYVFQSLAGMRDGDVRDTSSVLQN